MSCASSASIHRAVDDSADQNCSFKRARDLKNVEALTGGKSDPYVRVLRSGIVTGRTLVINNNLDPEWDEYVLPCPPVASTDDVQNRVHPGALA